MYYNQHSGGIARVLKLPPVAVSKGEKRAVKEFTEAHHISQAQAIRCGLVLLGALDTGSLQDVERVVAERVSRGQGLAAIRKAP